MKFEYPINGISTPINYHLNNTVGFYPIGRLFNWHGGLHVGRNTKNPIKAIADGVIVACRISKIPIEVVGGKYSNCFVLIQHTYKSPKGRELLFYSLYNNLMPYTEPAPVEPTSDEPVPVEPTPDESTPKGQCAEIFKSYTSKVVGTQVLAGSTGLYERLRLKSKRSKLHKKYVANGYIKNDSLITIGNNGDKIDGRFYEVIKINGTPVSNAVMWHKSLNANFKEVTRFELDKVISGDSCNIPVKAGDIIGYVGPHGYKQSEKYRAAHIEVFTDQDPTDFLTGKEGDKDDVSDTKKYLKIKKDAELTLKYPIKFYAGDEIEVLDVTKEYYKIKLHKRTQTVTYSDLIDPNKQDQGKWFYHPKNLSVINESFKKLLTKDSILHREEKLTDITIRKVSYTIPSGSHIYWIEKGAGKLNYTEKPAGTVVLSSDIDTLYDKNPNTYELSSKLGDDFIAPLSKLELVKSFINDDEWFRVKTFTPKENEDGFVQQVEIQGFIKKDLSDANQSVMCLISAFDWEAFGFTIFQDQPDQFIFNPKEAPAFLTSVWDFIGNGDKNLTPLELAKSLIDQFVAEKMSKMVCYHTSEWGVNAASLSSEVEALLDEGIDNDVDNKEELEAEKTEILDALKTKLENLDFWSKVKIPVPKTTPEVPEGYIYDPIVKKSRKRNTWEIGFEYGQEEVITETNILEPYYPNDEPEEKKEKEYFPFPISNKVYHFHPIAFVEQMIRVNGRGIGYVDWSFIKGKEGKEILVGYVPTEIITEEVTLTDKDGEPLLKDGKEVTKTISKKVAIGKSGVTIASGFDIGQHNKYDIKRIFSENTILQTKYLPYVEKRKQVAIDYLKNHPVSITEEQAKLTDKLVKDSQVNSLVRVYNQYKMPKEFKFQSVGIQTVVMSIAFQYGVYSSTLIGIWKGLESGDNEKIIKFWEKKAKGPSYIERRESELKYLKQHINDYK
jgi:hypothetical protein